jgi:hypothetical protein
MFYERVTFVPKKYIKHISVLCARNSNLRIFIDVLVNDIVRESNLLECFSSGDDNLTGTEDTTRDLLHLMGWFEFYFHSRVSIRFKGYFENIIVPFKPIRHFHKIDVVVETEIGIDHDNTESV